MEVIAKARYIRMSPRKVGLVIDLIRGMSVVEALTQLRFLRKDAALPVRKLIESATANAEHNFKSKKENLYIKEIMAGGGPTLNRWQPRARGRATPIRKRTCHITIVLDELKSQSVPVVKKGESIKKLKETSKTKDQRSKTKNKYAKTQK